MIYVTGDMHGDIQRFRDKALRRLKKNDTLIVCGDFGFLWDDSKKEQKLLRWIGKRRYNVLFVDGTHDNIDLINSYPASEWGGGQVRTISGRLRYLCRGEVFQLEDYTVFAFGGGESNDSDTRVQNETWWQEELPTQEEIDGARERLRQRDNKVDFIITHQCSRKMKKFLTMEEKDANILDTFFDEIRQDCSYKRWFFGGYHINKVIPPAEVAVFRGVVPITQESPFRE